MEYDVEQLKALHGKLQSIFDELYALKDNLPEIGTDTAVALGESMGVLSRTKALLGRDIDSCK